MTLREGEDTPQTERKCWKAAEGVGSRVYPEI